MIDPMTDLYKRLSEIEAYYAEKSEGMREIPKREFLITSKAIDDLSRANTAGSFHLTPSGRTDTEPKTYAQSGHPKDGERNATCYPSYSCIRVNVGFNTIRWACKRCGRDLSEGHSRTSEAQVAETLNPHHQWLFGEV